MARVFAFSAKTVTGPGLSEAVSQPKGVTPGFANEILNPPLPIAIGIFDVFSSAKATLNPPHFGAAQRRPPDGGHGTKSIYG
ncbi:MAG: hypothetical protein WBG42_10975, partial [Cryomorphaceae bacterium]